MKPRLQHRWDGWYCYADIGFAVWGVTPQIAYEHWLVNNPSLATPPEDK